MAEEVVLMLVGNSSDVFVSLNLGSGSRKEIDIHCIAVIASSKWTEVSRNMRAVIRGLDGE
jgi:hypothetical protein